MNKFIKIILAILGGVEVIFQIVSPILLVTLWVAVIGLTDWTSYFFYGIGFTSSLYRAIKIGFMKQEGLMSALIIKIKGEQTN